MGQVGYLRSERCCRHLVVQLVAAVQAVTVDLAAVVELEEMQHTVVAAVAPAVTQVVMVAHTEEEEAAAVVLTNVVRLLMLVVAAVVVLTAALAVPARQTVVVVPGGPVQIPLALTLNLQDMEQLVLAATVA